jgi:hypothetical protein
MTALLSSILDAGRHQLCRSGLRQEALKQNCKYALSIYSRYSKIAVALPTCADRSEIGQVQS